MHVDKFYKDSFILTLSNMVTGIIAFVFSLILSRELGAEGLGLYGLVMPIYGLLLCITSDFKNNRRIFRPQGYKKSQQNHRHNFRICDIVGRWHSIPGAHMQ